ncbi:type II toxin-antitoxin system VapC family toxin [Prosthecomicrobium sp. N25]|uniref:type II toxin-antitoxin system VapC family toxin n=1 Tax=Prosthecomicrobium sp. N25 TaxID=3129254 RepID=UPI0030776768
MIVDTSAIMAILLNEKEAVAFAELVANDAHPRMSAGNHVELVVTVTRRDRPIAWDHVAGVLNDLRLVIEPVTVEQAALARSAYLTYGRGQHPARLNFGDCFAYALAKATGEPLLYKGDDFGLTDVKSAL